MPHVFLRDKPGHQPLSFHPPKWVGNCLTFFFFCESVAKGRLCSPQDIYLYLSIYLFALAPRRYHLHTCRSIIMPCTTAFDSMYSFLLNSLSNALIVVYVHWSRNHICSPAIRPRWHLPLLRLLSLTLFWLGAKAGCCRISWCSTTCILSWHLNTKQRPHYRGNAALSVHPTLSLLYARTLSFSLSLSWLHIIGFVNGSSRMLPLEWPGTQGEVFSLQTTKPGDRS